MEFKLKTLEMAKYMKYKSHKSLSQDLKIFGQHLSGSGLGM